ncbi:MAG: preprotein translocase subunit SecG [Vicingaceae bacterium]|jgi:preprotein translocase subunit SecG|tara:strand:+ start:1680 stop:2036 length:357 start_codon:yes stop_codon:yes gene_type:complete
MYIIVSVLVFIIAVLLILVILVQNPKGGLASNFSSSNQVMGVRKTTDFLEKATWTLGIALIVLSIVSSATINRNDTAQIETVESELQGEADLITIPASQAPITNDEITADPNLAPSKK